jgi:hypothetical protein
MPERLTEHTTDWRTAGLAVDASNRIVRNVALTGLESRNGYRYREAALREALELYADKPVFLDHAPRSGRPHERSTRDLVGSIVEPRFENGRVRADVRVLDTEAGRTFLALAAANGPAVGMSHVVLAERSDDRTEVARLHDVVCVDAVVFPATTSTFRESTARDDTAGERGPAPQPDGERPSISDAPRTGDVESSDAMPGFFVNLRRERDAALRERDEFAARLERLELERESVERTRSVEALLVESRLPDHAITPTFRRQLLDATPDDRRELIAERRTLLAAAPHRGPVSPERRGDPVLDVDARLVRAIRRAA